MKYWFIVNTSLLTRHITLIHFFLVIMTNLEEKFLTRVGISKVECDAMIKSLIILNDIFSIHYQEMQSYTMRDDVVVIQFRKESIDLNTHEKAMKIHRFYILSITCKQSKPFHVYITSYDNRSCYAKEFHHRDFKHRTCRPPYCPGSAGDQGRAYSARGRAADHHVRFLVLNGGAVGEHQAGEGQLSVPGSRR